MINKKYAVFKQIHIAQIIPPIVVGIFSRSYKYYLIKTFFCINYSAVGILMLGLNVKMYSNYVPTAFISFAYYNPS